MKKGAPSDLVLLPGLFERALVAEMSRGLGLAERERTLEPFPDGELEVRVQGSLGGSDVYVVASTAPPVGERLLALLLLADACRRAEAAAVTAVIPYFGYARQNRRKEQGEPVGARVLADAVCSGRFDRVVVVDLHDPSLEGALGHRIEHLSAVPLLAEAIAPHVGPSSVLVAPDLGATKLAEAYAARLDLPIVVVHKQRLTGQDVSVRQVIGDVRGARPILVDDMISTAGTAAAAIEALLERKCAPDVLLAASHGLFAGPALKRLSRHGGVRVLTTDSVGRDVPAGLSATRISLAPLLAEAVRRLHLGAPLEDLLAAR